MGVRTQVVVYGPDEEKAQRAAASAFHQIARLEASFSDYRPDSEVSLVGDLSGQAPAHVSAELYEVLLVSRRVSEATGGAFDVTVGPATKVWRRVRRQGELPSAEEVERVRALIGWHDVAMRTAASSNGGEVMLLRKGMQIDLGGIGKGYAAQYAVDHLTLLGYPRCLVALAGDVVAGDPPPGVSGWKVEVRAERAGEAAPSVGVLWLRNAAASTAGDSEQFFELDGTRYSHIVDPRTGLGSRRQVMATVVAPRGEIADALDTSLCLIDPEDARRLIESFDGTACVVIEPEAPPWAFDPRGILRWQIPPSAR